MSQRFSLSLSLSSSFISPAEPAILIFEWFSLQSIDRWQTIHKSARNDIGGDDGIGARRHCGMDRKRKRVS